MQDRYRSITFTHSKKEKKERESLLQKFGALFEHYNASLRKKNWTNVVNKIVPIQINRLSSYLIILNKTTF